MNPGIYAIINLHNNKVYIGQARCLDTRRRHHFHKLRHNTHKCGHLQAAFNKYGEAGFRFDVLKACPPHKLDTLEKHYISEFNAANPEHGYNTEPGGLTRPLATGATRRRMQIAQSRRRAQYPKDAPDAPERPDAPPKNK